ncbi:MAG: hypothetical protein L3J66_10395 [Bacteroidales bacterium]|nr:hypothetical protein [Bacteroidales bacterium]
MKNQKFFTALYRLPTFSMAALLFTIAVVVVSCQKTPDVQEPVVTGLDEESNIVTQHILDFKAQMEYYRQNPGLRSEAKKEVLETILDWEADLSMSFCHSYLDLTDVVFYDTVIDLPLISDDSLWMTDVSSKYYDEIVLAVQTHYFAAPFSSKELMVADLEPVNGGDSVWVGTLIGNTQLFAHPPKDWYWGKTQGTCLDNEYYGTLDAAIKIAQNTRSHYDEDPPEGTSWYFTDLEEHVILNPLELDDEGNYIYINPNDDDDFDNFQDFLIYYANDDWEDGLIEDVRCLEHYGELAFYKQNYINITQTWIDSSGGKKFKECEYRGVEIDNTNENYLRHELTRTVLGFRYHTEIIVPTDDISTY